MNLDELEKQCEKKTETTAIAKNDAWKGTKHDGHLGGIEYDRPMHGPMLHWLNEYGRDITHDPYDFYNSNDDYYRDKIRM